MMMCGIVFVVVVILFAWIFVGTWNFRSNSPYFNGVNYALMRAMVNLSAPRQGGVLPWWCLFSKMMYIFIRRSRHERRRVRNDDAAAAAAAGEKGTDAISVVTILS